MKSKCGKFVLLDDDAKEMVDKLVNEVAEKSAHIEKLLKVMFDYEEVYKSGNLCVHNAQREFKRISAETPAQSLFDHDSKVVIKMFKAMKKAGIGTSKRVDDFIDGYVIGQLEKDNAPS